MDATDPRGLLGLEYTKKSQELSRIRPCPGLLDSAGQAHGTQLAQVFAEVREQSVSQSVSVRELAVSGAD